MATYIPTAWLRDGDQFSSTLINATPTRPIFLAAGLQFYASPHRLQYQYKKVTDHAEAQHIL
jgi:hypothetical protein